MQPVATDVARSMVCVSVCLRVGHTYVLCKKNSWTDWGAIGANYCCPRNHVLDGCQDWTNQFAITRSDKSAMQPCQIIWTLILASSQKALQWNWRL